MCLDHQFDKLESDTFSGHAPQARNPAPLEVDILEAGLDLRRTGGARFHGFQLAKAIADHAGPRPLTSHGTLYEALQRLEEAGLLEGQWEDPDIAAAEARPRRRLYSVTGAGERALVAWQARYGRAAGRPGLEPT
jgi:PadR family transcriptional regulator, regulatory protein PadR